MAAQAGQDAHFDLGPSRFASGVASLWTKRHHHPIGPKGQGHRRSLGRQWLLGRQVSLRGSLQLRVELLQSPLPSRLAPFPHRPWAHRHPTGPAQQRGCGGKRPKDGERTAQTLALPARALMGLQS